ncbi:hypothetical protein CPY51_07465 [Rhizobium tubonense]|uniref:Uncharacterized protein n=1 Tax=Rhizobium tubonense TaxID=484088 RepID=A0A2W4CSD5_9HYPH|nr:hypothetical protein CPY51_07465 [Rhizobium tubonense]
MSSGPFADSLIQTRSHEKVFGLPAVEKIPWETLVYKICRNGNVEQQREGDRFAGASHDGVEPADMRRLEPAALPPFQADKAADGWSLGRRLVKEAARQSGHSGQA